MEELKQQIEELKRQISTKDELLQTLKQALELKDEQIQTLKDSLELKNQQLQTLESSLEVKNEKISTLEKSIKIKEEELKTTEDSSFDQEIVKQKNGKIAELKKNIELLNEELEKADEDFEKLESEIEKIRKSASKSLSSGIVDYTKVNIEKAVIIDHMREIIGNALHSVMIAVPKITDLQDLYLYEVRSSVIMKISCLINPGIDEHSELLEEFESLDNISIRLYEGEDRFVILRDGEELLFAVIGNEDNNFLAFHTRDSKHIKLFQAVVMETWLRSKNI